jgi:hypothetical protein
MRQTILALFLLSAFSISTNGKIKVRVTVDISNKKYASELLEAVQAKINSTDRYAVVSKASDVDMLLSLMCIEATSTSNRQLGFTCSSGITYYPFIDSALNIELIEAETIVNGGLEGTEFIATNISNRFINGTTDEKLTQAKDELLSYVQSFCRSRPDDCAIQNKK